MKHKFDIKTLQFSKNIAKNRAFYIKVKIQDHYEFSTAIQHINNNKRVPFFQTNQVNVQKPNISIYAFYLYQIIDDSEPYMPMRRYLQCFTKNDASNKLVFKFKDKQLSGTLHFNVSKINHNLLSIRRKQSISVSNHLKNEMIEFSETFKEDNVGYLQLAALLISFAHRIRPVVLLYNYVREVFSWKSPLHTVTFGLILSLIIFNLKMALIVCGVASIYKKKSIIQILFKKIKFQQFKSKLIPDSKNLTFLQMFLQTYTRTYQHIRESLEAEDKTELIILLNQFFSLAWLLVISLLLLGLDTISVIVLWTTLLICHERGYKTFEAIIEFHYHSTKYILKLIETSHLHNTKLKNIMLAFSSKPIQIIKTFYIYQYEQWWIDSYGQPWKNKWSDFTAALDLLPPKHPPKGYQWTEEWKVVVGQNTDSEGYEYAVQSVYEFHRQKGLLDYVRRRQWKRSCTTKQA